MIYKNEEMFLKVLLEDFLKNKNLSYLNILYDSLIYDEKIHKEELKQLLDTTYDPKIYQLPLTLSSDVFEYYFNLNYDELKFSLDNKDCSIEYFKDILNRYKAICKKKMDINLI